MFEKNRVLMTNILFLLVSILIITIGSYVQGVNQDIGLLITEYILVLLPCLLFIRSFGLDYREGLRLNPISLLQVTYIILIMLFTYPVGAFLNNIVANILMRYIPVPGGVAIPLDFGEYIKSIFIIAISAGICEEVLCRGIVLNGYKGLGKRKSILISSILFGMLHFNPYNLVGPIFIGYVLGELVYRSDSLYSGILGHILNNGIALTLGYYLIKLEEAGKVIGANNSGTRKEVLTSWLLGLVLIGVFIAIIRILLEAFPTVDRKEDFMIEKGRIALLDFIPIIIFIWIFIIVNSLVFWGGR